MAKRSKMVMRRRQAAKHLRTAVERYGGRVAKTLEKRLEAVLREGEEMPDVKLFLDLVVRLLWQESEGLEETENERRHGKFALRRLQRRQRNPASDELRDEIVALRKQLIGIYGPSETAEILGFKGRTPRGHEDVLRFGRYLERNLRGMKLPDPESRVAEKPDPDEWADALEPLVKKLGEKLGQVEDRSWDEFESVVGRNKMIGTFDQDRGPATQLIQGACLLAGEEALAGKLRPDLPRRLANRRTTHAESEAKAQAAASPRARKGISNLLVRMVPSWFRRKSRPATAPEKHERKTSNMAQSHGIGRKA